MNAYEILNGWYITDYNEIISEPFETESKLIEYCRNLPGVRLATYSHYINDELVSEDQHEF